MPISTLIPKKLQLIWCHFPSLYQICQYLYFCRQHRQGDVHQVHQQLGDGVVRVAPAVDPRLHRLSHVGGQKGQAGGPAWVRQEEEGQKGRTVQGNGAEDGAVQKQVAELLKQRLVFHHLCTIVLYESRFYWVNLANSHKICQNFILKFEHFSFCLFSKNLSSSSSHTFVDEKVP